METRFLELFNIYRIKKRHTERKTNKKRLIGAHSKLYRRPLYSERSSNLVALYPSGRAKKKSTRPYCMVVAVWSCPRSFFSPSPRPVPKNHRVHRRANYRIAIARTHNVVHARISRPRAAKWSRTPVGIGSASRWSGGARGVGRATEQRQRYN